MKTGILYFTTCFHGFAILRHVDPFVRMLHKYGINFQSLSLAHCIKVATTGEQLDSQSYCLIKQLRILLQSRCNEYVINRFTYDEITELIREIACH